MSTETKALGNPLVTGISAGLVIGVVDVIYAISLAALIFAGDVSSFVANGIGLILLGWLPPLLLINLFSSHKGNFTAGQDAPAAILAVTAAGIMRNMLSTTPQEKFITVVATSMLTTLLTGLVFVLLGQFKLGSLVRFLPYPVIGGFLAGTGWLLVTGGIGVMTDASFSLDSLGFLFQPGILIRWAPGLVFAFVTLLILNRYDHFLILPGMLIGSAILFYAVVFITHTPVSALSTQGWLLGPFAGGGLWKPLSLTELNLIDWHSILMHAGGMASVLMISVVTLLLNASGLELVIRKDLDLNHELRVIGLANIFGGLLGGIICFHDLTDTAINHTIGRDSRISSWVAAAILALPLFFGAALLSYVPKITLGVMLILFGLSFLYEWIYRSWFNFSKLEYAVIVLILIVIATLGYLQGVGLGIVAAVVLFVINYSRVSVTKHALSGAELQSRFTRSPNQRKTLIEQGEKNFILQLQGFIFFGTANKLLEQVRSRIEEPKQVPLQFLILDFAKVSGLDSTALLSFSKMKQILQDRGISILVTGPSAEILNQLEKGGFILKDSETAQAFPDLDHGLEWVENKILNTASIAPEQTISLKELFHQLLPEETHLNDLFKFLEKKIVKTGDYLMRQEDAPDNIYFVESGQVTAQLEFANKQSVRLESMKSGRVIGELGFYLGQKRTAGVVADEPSVIYLLTAKNLAKMEKQAPAVASYFHQLIIQLMAERTTHLIRTVAALEK
jgi:sulfate permease, SulP family